MARFALPKSLDKASMVPLYRQLAQSLEKGIREGSIPEGARIPSEQELMRQFEVSRVTVRQALGDLHKKNIVARKQGMGTFVQRPVMTQEVDDLFGFYPSLLSKGLNPKIRILDYAVVVPDREVREKLGLSPGDKILRFTRQYLLEGSLFLIIQMHIPLDLARNWSAKDASAQNSFRLLQEKAGVQIQSSSVTIRASLAMAKIGKWLQIPKGSPILELRRLTYSTEKRPVEYAILVFPGESYEFTTRISAGGKEGLNLGRRRPESG